MVAVHRSFLRQPVYIIFYFVPCRLKNTVGVFWLNTAETWVDILSHADQNVLSSIVNLVSGSNAEAQIDAHFMSESGIIDTFFLLGPKPDDVLRQYASLTGTAPLQQVRTFLSPFKGDLIHFLVC